MDAFEWQKGAVGFHVASSEGTALKKENSQVGCRRMIEDGVCATVGPVGEPYLQSFPEPEVFFGLPTEGVLSLGECYTVSLPCLSWKMVLIGDPLYRPFRSSQRWGRRKKFFKAPFGQTSASKEHIIRYLYCASSRTAAICAN